MSVIVIGGGIAGLSAAHHLVKQGQEVLLLEAKNRLGGRTYTDRTVADHPVELGAEFIHGDRAATWELVNKLGLQTQQWRKAEDSLVRLEDGAWLSMPEAMKAYPEFAQTRTWSLPEVSPLLHEDFYSYLIRLGFTKEQLRYVRRSLANACGESSRFLSAKAILALINNHESGVGDYRILDGYDQIINHLSKALEVSLEDPVTRISWHDKVRIETLSGEIYQADHGIVTVPLGVLQAEAIHFSPALPDSKQQALKGLRMGPAIKMVYNFSEPILPESIMAVYSRYNPPMWWSPSFGFNTHHHVWTAFVTGEWAMELLTLGEQGALEQGLTSLAMELDKPLPKVQEMFVENWPHDPYTRGGYSFLLPGHDGAREKLAQPTPPLYWAGEACEVEHRAQTVHGAYLSGQRAAQEVINSKH